MKPDRNVPEKSGVEWEKVKAEAKALLPEMIEEGMALFKGVKREQTRECLLAALRRLSDPEAASDFRSLFYNTRVYWGGISPEESLHPLRAQYGWLCCISLALDRREWRRNATRNDLGPQTREVAEQHTMMLLHLAEEIPRCWIGTDYLKKISDLTLPSDRAAELKASLTMTLRMDVAGFAYKKLHQRLQTVIGQKTDDDAGIIRQVQELEAMVEEFNRLKAEPFRLDLLAPYEHGLFTVIKSMARRGDEAAHVQAAKRLVAELRRSRHLPCGRWMKDVAKQRLSQALQAATCIPGVSELGLCPADEPQSAEFLAAAVDELLGNWPNFSRSKICVVRMNIPLVLAPASQ